MTPDDLKQRIQGISENTSKYNTFVDLVYILTYFHIYFQMDAEAPEHLRYADAGHPSISSAGKSVPGQVGCPQVDIPRCIFPAPILVNKYKEIYEHVVK